MNWFVAALIAAVALSGQSLFYQRLQKLYPITTYMTYVWFGSALALGLVFLRQPDLAPILRNILPLALAGVTSFVGTYAYNQAIKTQNNLGYIEAIISIRAAIAFVFSIVVLNAPFDWLKLAGVSVVMLGVLLVAEAFPVRTNRQAAKSNEKVSQPSSLVTHHSPPVSSQPSSLSPQPSSLVTRHSPLDRLGWLGWAALAALMFSLMPIFLRYATDDGTRAEVALVVVLVVAGLLFMGWGAAAKSSFQIAPAHRTLLGAAIAFATVGNAADFIAFQNTPNLAYAVAIGNTRMIILYILGIVLFAEKLQRLKAIGILLTFAGVILLS